MKTGCDARSTMTGVFLVSGFCLLASVGYAQDAQTLLSQMKTAESTISYSAMRSGGGATARVFRSGEKQRLEWLTPSVRKDDFLLDDGGSVYLYHRADNSVTKTDSRSHVPSYVALGTATSTTFAGRHAFSVPIANNRTVFIDAATKALLGMKSSNGGFALTQIRFGAVPAAKFQFAAPAGAAVTAFPGALYNSVNAAKRTAAWLVAPPKLPTGWTFESALASSNSAWLRYSNGQNRISLFEQPTGAGDGNYAPKAVKGGGKFWRKGGIRFLATGSPPSAIEEVVNGLK